MELLLPCLLGTCAAEMETQVQVEVEEKLVLPSSPLSLLLSLLHSLAK